MTTTSRTPVGRACSRTKTSPFGPETPYARPCLASTPSTSCRRTPGTPCGPRCLAAGSWTNKLGSNAPRTSPASHGRRATPNLGAVAGPQARLRSRWALGGGTGEVADVRRPARSRKEHAAGARSGRTLVRQAGPRPRPPSAARSGLGSVGGGGEATPLRQDVERVRRVRPPHGNLTPGAPKPRTRRRALAQTPQERGVDEDGGRSRPHSGHTLANRVPDGSIPCGAPGPTDGFRRTRTA